MATLAESGPEVRAEVKQVREVVASLHEQLIKWNLVVWTAGNVSQRLRTADLMVIKPSGLRYEYLTPSSMVVCDLDGTVIEGIGTEFQAASYFASDGLSGKITRSVERISCGALRELIIIHSSGIRNSLPRGKLFPSSARRPMGQVRN